MRKRLVRVLLVLIITIFSMQIDVQATVIKSTDKEVKSNSGNVTISVTSKQALGAYTLKLSDSAGLELVGASGGEISADKKTITGSSATGTTNLGAYTFKVPTVTSDKTYKIKFSISGMETTTLEEIAAETNTAVLTVKAPVVEKPKEPETPTTTTPEPETPTATKSSEARLSNLGIKPNDFSGFSKNINQENWNTTVPNEVTEVEVYATPKDSKATVEGTGKVSLKEGDNKVSIKVTAEDGKTTKTYKLTIKRKTAAEEEVENGEARLKTLGIKPEKYDFTGFDSEKTEYSVKVPNDVEEIEVYATAMNSKAQITGTGMIELEEGKNELLIEVIAANGEKKTYTLTVTREETDETTGTTIEKFGLSTLSIKGLKLSPTFDVETYEYTATLTEEINSLEIIAKANTQGSKVEIIGNENLQQGENVITILVSNKITEENATYQITVNKNVIVEETVQTSWLKPSTWGKEEKIKLLIIAVLIILIISAIILKVKISNEENKHIVKDLPGADELDRAIAEHQELSEEANYIEEIAKNRFAVQDFDEKTKRKGRHF